MGNPDWADLTAEDLARAEWLAGMIQWATGLPRAAGLKARLLGSVAQQPLRRVLLAGVR